MRSFAKINTYILNKILCFNVTDGEIHGQFQVQLRKKIEFRLWIVIKLDN